MNYKNVRSAAALLLVMTLCFSACGSPSPSTVSEPLQESTAAASAVTTASEVPPASAVTTASEVPPANESTATSEESAIAELGEVQNDGSFLDAIPQGAPNAAAKEGELVRFENVTASSTHEPEQDYRYDPALAYDYLETTAWVEGATGLGEGEWIEFSSAQPQMVHEIRILNGYEENPVTFAANAIVTSVRISFSDGSERVYPLTGHWQEIVLDQPVATTSVRLTILAATTKNTLDTCISEVAFYDASALPVTPQSTTPATA